MIEEKDQQASETQRLQPGTWEDLFLYLFGGMGLLLIASLGLSVFITEITFTATVLVLLLNVLFLGGSVYLLGIRRGKISWESLGISPPVWEQDFLRWGVFLVLALFPIRAAAGYVVEILVHGNLESLEMRSDLLGVDTPAQFLILLAGAGVLAPISEELFFRGLLYNWFRQRSGAGVSVGVSSLMFGLAHYDSLAVLVSSMMMGVVIALAYERTKSMWMPIVLHVVNNSIALSLVYLIQTIERNLPGEFPSAF